MRGGVIAASVMASAVCAAGAVAMVERAQTGSDFGDAPDGRRAGYAAKPSVVGRFPSKAASGGPRHGSAGPRIGSGWSAEPDSRQVDRDADDGASLEAKSCRLSTVSVALDVSRVPAGARVYVNAWFDWNQDGDWADAAARSCGPEWGVQNYEIDPATAGPDKVALVAIRFRAGRVPGEFWWRVQAHTGEPVAHAGGAQSTLSGGGETEDRLHSLSRTGPVDLACNPSTIPHGGPGLPAAVNVRLIAPPRSEARLRRPAQVRLLGATDGVRISPNTRSHEVEIDVYPRRHRRKSLIQHLRIVVRATVLLREGRRVVVEAECPMVIVHTLRVRPRPAAQPERGPATALIDPDRPDPASAACKADVAIAERVTVRLRCDGANAKSASAGSDGVTVSDIRPAADGSAALAYDCEGTDLAGTVARCYWRAGNRGRTLTWSYRPSRGFSRVRIFVLAGGLTPGKHRGTTIVLRQDWFVTAAGLRCSQGVPRADSCATP